jgi:hypothetical protein
MNREKKKYIMELVNINDLLLIEYNIHSNRFISVDVFKNLTHIMIKSIDYVMTNDDSEVCVKLTQYEAE